MPLTTQVLETQLSIADLLSSMFYGEGELEIDDETVETIAALRDYLDTPTPKQSASSFRNMHISVYIPVSDTQTLVLTVTLHLRAPLVLATSSRKLPPLLELSIKHSSWLSRAMYEDLLASLPPYTGSLAPDVQGAEDARDWLMQTIEHLQSESTTSKLKSPLINPPPTSTPKIRTNPDLVTRAWFYLPSLSTRSKRTDIITLAPDHSITGFVLAGKPGLLCIESPTPLGPDTFIAQIKTTSWADVPSHQKKITERYRESGVKRAFESMDEVTEMISTRGARANRGDMGEVRVFLEKRGLKGVLEIVLGANEFK
ncbi:RWD domain-containing protein 2B [Ceratobasidium sp. UAMH 11750]|nr:RWD domain-containing protein 2B [Ceratobasidium sp. UAMH 11750]